MGVAGRLSGTVSPLRAEQGTSLETPSRARASSCQAAREPGRAPPRHAHGDLTSLAPHERLPEILVVPREKSPTRNSRKTTWFPPLGKMRPLPATASQGKSPVPPLRARPSLTAFLRRDSRGERSPWLPLETRPDSPGEPGMQPRGRRKAVRDRLALKGGTGDFP